MAAENKILDYIQLINSANIGPVTFYKLLRQYGSAEAALAALPAGRRTFRVRPLKKNSNSPAAKISGSSPLTTRNIPKTFAPRKTLRPSSM